jgi:hypothetical protein
MVKVSLGKHHVPVDVSVSFEAWRPDGGEGELTWGQQGIWNAIQGNKRTMNIGGVMPLASGTSLAEMTQLLGFIMSRHPALRTRMREVPGQHFPRQVVATSGEITLRVIEVQGDPGEAAEALRIEWEEEFFAYETEWPIRMAVVCHAGELTHLVVQYCHLAVDGHGIAAVVRDLGNLDQPGSTPGGLTPLELAAAQQTTAGLKASQRSLRYWEGLLRSVPAGRFGPAPVAPLEPRFVEVAGVSPAMRLAAYVVADRVKVDTSHVLFAAFAVALARVTGETQALAQVVVSNRFRPGFADMASQLSQTTLYAVETAGCAFDEVVRRSWKAATSANLYGYYDPVANDELAAQVDLERGEHVDLSCFFNDRRQPAEPGPLATPAELAEAKAQTSIRFDRTSPDFGAHFFLQIDSEPDANAGRAGEGDGIPAIHFAIWADTAYLSLGQIEACAREFEAVTVDAAFGPVLTLDLDEENPGVADATDECGEDSRDCPQETAAGAGQHADPGNHGQA